MNPAAEAQVVEDVQGDGRWMSLHKRFLLEAKEREPEVVFIGDSLIAQLQHMPIWQQMFEPLHCLNFGIGADQTQHVLWRVQNGELDNMEPKVVVMLVGTNNHDHTGEQVVGGIVEIVSAIHTKQPQAQVVVMGIPPRGENRNHLREKILQINTSLAEQLKGKGNVTFLNIDASWGPGDALWMKSKGPGDALWMKSKGQGDPLWMKSKGPGDPLWMKSKGPGDPLWMKSKGQGDPLWMKSKGPVK